MVPRREHTARLLIQSEVEDKSLQRIAGEFAPGIDATVGKLRSTSATAVVLVHFDAARFTVDGVRAWLRAKGFKPIEFIPALGHEEAHAAAAPANLTLTCRADVWLAAERGNPTTFTMTVYTGGALRVAGWPEPVAIDLASLELPGFLPVVGAAAAADDRRVRAGRCEPQVLRNELVITGTLSPATEAGRQIIERAVKGEEIRAAVVVAAQKNEVVLADGFAIVNGREMSGPIVVVRRGAMRDVAFLTEGAAAEIALAEAPSPTDVGAEPAGAIAKPLSAEDAAEAGALEGEPLPTDVPSPADAGNPVADAVAAELEAETVGEGPTFVEAESAAEAREVAVAWENLPLPVRRQILDMIRKSGQS
jgi:hypothetical protein